MRALVFSKQIAEQSASKPVRNKSIVKRIGMFFAALMIMSSGLSGMAQAAPGDLVWQEAGAGVRAWTSITSSADGTKLAATASAGSIYTSTDSGATWTERTGAGSWWWTSITSSADGTKLAAAAHEHIYTSTDSGVTWTEQTGIVGATNWTSIVSSADGTKLAVIAYGDGLEGHTYTSSDSGVTWTYQAGTLDRSWSGVASSADGTKLAVTGGGYSQGIYTSSDSGVTWTEQTSAGSRSWGPIASSSDNTKLVAAVGYGGGYIYTSSDSGVTWAEQTSAGSRTWTALASSADGTKLAATADGSIYTSTDSGVTWIEQTGAGSRNWSAITMSSDGSKIAAAVNGGSIYLGSVQGAATTSIPFSTLTSGNNVAPSPIVSGATLFASSMTCYTFGSGSVKTLGVAGMTAPEQNVNLLGGIAYDLTCTGAGGSADVSLALNAQYTDTSKLRVYKQDPTTKVLTDITSQVTFTEAAVSSRFVTAIAYTATDGAAFDEDGVANSTIVDPLFIGEVAGASTTLASTGVNIWVVVGGTIAFLSAAIVVVGQVTRRTPTVRFH